MILMRSDKTLSVFYWVTLHIRMKLKLALYKWLIIWIYLIYIFAISIIHPYPFLPFLTTLRRIIYTLKWIFWLERLSSLVRDATSNGIIPCNVAFLYCITTNRFTTERSWVSLSRALIATPWSGVHVKVVSLCGQLILSELEIFVFLVVWLLCTFVQLTSFYFSFTKKYNFCPVSVGHVFAVIISLIVV